MYRLEREDFVRTPYISLWSTLGFQAGFLNAFGFLACGRYISHVTGMGTQVGVALAEQRPWFALELIGFPTFFIAGAFLSGLMTSARIEQGKKPSYGTITFLLPALITVILVAGRAGVFGPFGEELSRTRDFALLYLLSFVCGLQNGCFATLTKGQIRTTHLTGISTDIGTDLARLWFGNLKPQEHDLTRRTNFSRLSTFICFALGSVVSVMVTQRIGYSALSVPLATSMGAALVVQKMSRLLDLKIAPTIPRVQI
jgi:uncharacterized membrane protein YoaK (UPF0700 family)